MKNKRVVCLIIFVILFIFLNKLSGSMKEGLNVNNCSAFNSNNSVEKNCANCLAVVISQNASNDGNKCYWNNTTKQCGSFSGSGFKDTCTTTPTTTTTTTTTTDSKSCAGNACPVLTLLDTPTWLKYSNSNALTLVDTPTWIAPAKP